jgi:inner membrane protein
MPSALSHPAPALAIATYFGGDRLPRSAIVAGVMCSVLPDVDILGFRLGIVHGGMFAHRGLTHSLPFALAVAVAAAIIVRRRDPRLRVGDLCFYLFLATASHGAFDALTNGGLGVAFFAPFSSARYFFAFRPIEVSPLSVGAISVGTRLGRSNERASLGLVAVSCLHGSCDPRTPIYGRWKLKTIGSFVRSLRVEHGEVPARGTRPE